MKKLSKISLLKLEKESLSDQEMRCLKGGFNDCSCGCHYAYYGGSSSANNMSANVAKNLHSYGGGYSCNCLGGKIEASANAHMHPDFYN